MPATAIIANVEAEKSTSDRYDRQRMMGWWDQYRVADARVLVAGAGAIGNEVVKLLALMGVNNLLIVDFDRIEITNLSRSVLFRDADVGGSKAIVAARRARELNPDSNAVGIESDLEFDIGLGIYRNVDVVIGCLDSINSRLALNRAALRADTPWLNGGIEATFGEVSLHTDTAACFECGMTDSMWERRNKRFSCSGQQALLPPDAVPTTATMASIIAGYLVNEALLLIHAKSMEAKKGLKPGQKLILSLQPYDYRIVDLTRNVACTAHETWTPVHELEMIPEKTTPVELLAAAGNPDGVVELGFDLLTEMTCFSCGSRQEMLIPVEKSASTLTICPACGGDTRQPISINWLDASSPYAHLPMSSLCVPQHQIMSINAAESRRYYQLSGEEFFSPNSRTINALATEKR